MYRNAMQATELLLEAGADVNSRNGKRSITPIMIAGAVGQLQLLEMMASHYTADVNIQVGTFICCTRRGYHEHHINSCNISISYRTHRGRRPYTTPCLPREHEPFQYY